MSRNKSLLFTMVLMLMLASLFAGCNAPPPTTALERKPLRLPPTVKMPTVREPMAVSTPVSQVPTVGQSHSAAQPVEARRFTVAIAPLVDDVDRKVEKILFANVPAVKRLERSPGARKSNTRLITAARTP